MVDGINSKKALVSGLKAGLHKADLGENTDNKMKSLFDIIDKDKNGVLDKEEINKFYNGDGETKGLNRNGDGKITRREAKKFLKAHQEELKNAGFTKKDMIEILNQFAADGENIEGMTGDSQKGYEVTYKDSENKRTIDKDGNYSNFDKDGNGETYDVNNTHLSSTKVDKENNTTTVTSYNNGEEESIDKVVTKKNDGSETTTVQYHDFGSGSEPTTKKVEKGSTVENYDIITDENGERTERILNKTIDKGNGVKEEHKYDYREDGSFTETIKDNVNPNNSTIYNCDKEGNHLNQSKTVDGKQYSVEYDGKGNTKVVLQKGETLEQLAKEFGCSVDDLKALNVNNKIAYGDNVIVPNEYHADDDKIKNRKSSADVKSEVKAEEDAKEAERKHQAEIAERKRAIAKAQREAENAQLKPLGLKDRKGAGEKVDAHFGKTNRHVQLTKVGNAVNGRTICKDKSGKYYVVAHDGVILKEEYVKSTSLYAAGNKVDCVVKDKNGNKTNVKYAEVPGYKDKHGRTLVVDKNGKFYLRAHDGSLLKSDYVDRVERSDAIREDSAKAQEATFDLLDSQVASAEEAFNQQLKNDGWAGDVADGVSILWGSKNRASEVRKDLAKLRSDIAECKLAAQNEGDAGFKAKFKEKFGIDYNQNTIADYVKNPSAENYRKAFGTKQPIGERVAEYNQSQQTGATVVKTTVKVAGAVAAGVVTGGLAGAAVGAAVVSGVVEETDRMNITGSYTDAQGNTQKTEGTFREGTDHLQILRDAALDGGAVLAGGLAGKTAQVLVKGTQVTNAAGQTVNVLTKGQKVAQAGIMTSGDVAYGAAQEYIQTGEVSVEGTLMNAALSAVGNAASAGAFKKSPKPQGPKTLDNATGNGTKTTGGKLSDAKLDKVKNEVRDEIRSGATPERTAQIYKEADLHQAVNRKQGREIEHVVEQEAGFETHHKQRTETKDGGQAVIDKINENVERTSDAILKEKNAGALAPHDAATLEDNLVNNLNTKEEIEQFKQQLKERVGMDEKGSMFKYEVQGKDHAADLISKADKKLKQLADFDEVLNSIPAKGGMGDLTSIKSFINKPSTTAQQLDELIAKMEANPQLKKFGGTKKLVADMKAKSELLKTKTIAAKVETQQPKVSQISEQEPVVVAVAPEKIMSADELRATLHQRAQQQDMDLNELSREIGNGGNPLPDNYISNSKDVRQHFLDSMETGDYLDSVDSYMRTINRGHELAFAGSNGTSYYYTKEGHLVRPDEINPGQIMGTDVHPHNSRIEESQFVESIAKKYGDNYSLGEDSRVQLQGISQEALPYNFNGMHRYAPGTHYQEYFTQMHRTAKNCMNLIESGASKREVLEAIAEHYQYAANVRCYNNINNSLFMNEVNTMLVKAGMPTMPQGMLDHVAQRFQPDSFKKYFVDYYKKSTGADIDSNVTRNINNSSSSSKVSAADSPEVEVVDVSPAKTSKHGASGIVDSVVNSKAVASAREGISNLRQGKPILVSSREAAINRLIEQNNANVDLSLAEKELKNKQLQRLRAAEQIRTGFDGAIKLDNLKGNIEDFVSSSKAVVALIDNPLDVGSWETVLGKAVSKKFEGKLDKIKKKYAKVGKLDSFQKTALNAELNQLKNEIKEAGNVALKQLNKKIDNALNEHGYHIDEHGVIVKNEAVPEVHVLHAEPEPEFAQAVELKDGEILAYDEAGRPLTADDIFANEHPSEAEIIDISERRMADADESHGRYDEDEPDLYDEDDIYGYDDDADGGFSATEIAAASTVGVAAVSSAGALASTSKSDNADDDKEKQKNKYKNQNA